MHTSHRWLALPVALAFAASAMAADSTTDDAAVAKLKSRLSSTSGFEVENVQAGANGVSCIVYRQGGETKNYAVVDGDKVLRSTSRSKEFENAWKEKCVGGGDTATRE